MYRLGLIIILGSWYVLIIVLHSPPVSFICSFIHSSQAIGSQPLEYMWCQFQVRVKWVDDVPATAVYMAN